MNRFSSLFLSGVFLAALNAPAHAGMRTETICGWIDFEGQYNISLTDAYDTYVLSNDVGEVPGVKTVQIGQHGPKWMDPNASESRYCGCISASFNGAELATINSFKQKQISACFNDPKLPKLEAAAAPAPAGRAPAPAPATPAPAPAAPAPAPMASASPTPPPAATGVAALTSGGYFTLTTMYRENAGECLESGGGGSGPSYTDQCQNVTGQKWKAIDQGNGYFHLTTQYREGAGECLEGNQPNGSAMNGASFMAGCQNASGQMWKAIDQGNGYFRLTTQFREGANECLEGREVNGGPKNGAAYMDTCQNVSSQFWKAIPAR